MSILTATSSRAGDCQPSTGQTLTMTPAASHSTGPVLIGTALVSALRALCAPVLHPIADELEARRAAR